MDEKGVAQPIPEKQGEKMKIRRPAVEPLSEWAAWYVRSLGTGTLDMGNAAVREKIEDHVKRCLRVVLNHTLRDLQKGAKRGMEQTLDFMLDANHAETVRERRIQRQKIREMKVVENQRARLKNMPPVTRFQ